MKTQAEIVARFEARKKADVLEFEVGEYINCLDYEHAKPYLKPEATEVEWDRATLTEIGRAGIGTDAGLHEVCVGEGKRVPEHFRQSESIALCGVDVVAR